LLVDHIELLARQPVFEMARIDTTYIIPLRVPGAQ